MGSFVNRPTTSKQRHRQAAKRHKLRQNAKEKHSASKRGFLKHQGGKKKNRVDKRALTEKSTRTAVELLEEVKAGKVKLSGDPLDARALADLLKAEGPAGKKTLASDKLSAVPQNEGLARLNAALDRELDAAQVPAPKKNSNQYARRGPSYNFWDRMGLHPLVMAALKEMAFTHPTPIQAETLPSVLATSHNDRNPDHRREDFRKDFVVSAETGSGKTLVFALPVIQSILASKADQIAAAQAVAKVQSAVPARTSLARARGGKSARPAEDKELEEMDANEEEEQEEEEVEEHDDRDEERENAGGEEDEEGDEEDDEEQDGEDNGEDEGDDEGLEEVEIDHDESVHAAFANATKVLHTLILSPTRELAQQIHDAMKKLTTKCREFVHVASIVGGMAPSKQQRILNRMPDVLICTPGRLWDLVKKNEGAFLGHSISRRLQYVVLDEADRLVESNRFEELKSILERVRCTTLPHGVMEGAEDEETPETLTAGAWDPIKKEFVPVHQPKRTRKDEPRPMRFPPEPPLDHRTTFFVTSATLSLQVNFQNKNAGEKKILRTKNASTMHIVMKDLGINEKAARVFDLAPDANVVARLQETYLRCPEGSKELYLYYFLQQYCKTGRTVVFVNAISMLRRIVKIFEILRVPIAGLHASMQQRQRLKIIDKFRAGERSVLVATDVAARGLDIEGVKYVVHFQLARSTDTYIHRCGRTARCGSEGFSCVFVHPDEFHPYQQLMHSMGRSAKLEVFSLDQSIVRKLYPHLQLALEIDKLSRGARKTHADQGWVARAAQEADLDAEDMIDDSAAAKNREQIKVAKTLRKRLDAMLKQDVGAKGAYLTSPRALGAAQAVADVHRRATRQIRMHRTE